MIARSKPGCAAQAGSILSDWIDETPWMPRLHTRDQDQAFCAHLIRTSKAYVASQDDEVFGFLAHDDADVSALYLNATRRGQGIGTALLDQAKQDLPQFTLWTFQANDGACRFYQREGLQEVQRTDGSRNDEKLPDVQFSWRG